jgi:hypothetical protein
VDDDGMFAGTPAARRDSEAVKRNA